MKKRVNIFVLSLLFISAAVTAQPRFGFGYGAAWFVPGLHSIEAGVENFTGSPEFEQKYGPLTKKATFINMNHGPVIGYYGRKRKTAFTCQFFNLHKQFISIRESQATGPIYHAIKLRYHCFTFGFSRALTGKNESHRIGMDLVLGTYRIFSRSGDEATYNKGYSGDKSVKNFGLGFNINAQLYNRGRLMLRPYLQWVVLTGNTGVIADYTLPYDATVNPAHIGMQVNILLGKKWK